MLKIVSMASMLAIFAHGFSDNALKEIPIHGVQERKAPAKKATFSPFTGKVVGSKVRMRLQPDLEGSVVKELVKDELVSVVGQEGEFYLVSAPEELKAYVFRSFVLENVVEGNRVNIRLEPDLESAVIGHLNSGDRVDGKVCEQNKKWLEIATPEKTHFYVAKNFIEFAGSPDLKKDTQQKRSKAALLLEEANAFAKAEMEKSFEQIAFDTVKQAYLTILHDYADFPNYVQTAKDTLASLRESYLQKRIAHLENKAALASHLEKAPPSIKISSPMMWNAIEDSLYKSWAATNDQKDLDAFYEEQKLTAKTITGVLETFHSSVSNPPGEYVLKDKNLPVAYIYSTKVDLKNHIGKKVTLTGSLRPKYNFAFPAYFVHDVE